MNGAVSHNAALKGYIGPGTTWTNEVHFVMNHSTGAGSLTQPVDQQSSATGAPTVLTYITGDLISSKNAFSPVIQSHIMKFPRNTSVFRTSFPQTTLF